MAMDVEMVLPSVSVATRPGGCQASGDRSDRARANRKSARARRGLSHRLRCVLVDVLRALRVLNRAGDRPTWFAGHQGVSFRTTHPTHANSKQIFVFVYVRAFVRLCMFVRAPPSELLAQSI